ncbi:hypothetical protein [Streptomyces sp. NPDC058665]|uniref:hypothetical protein n=1 Tax=Streptomyces sp. NPDC058665 TaxID=3346586 RepID=UPI00364CFC9F
MSKVKIRTVTPTEVPALLDFWARSAEGASIIDDVDGGTRLLPPVPPGRRPAMVLDHNELAHHAWAKAGYAPQARWSRWVRPLDGVEAPAEVKACPGRP